MELGAWSCFALAAVVLCVCINSVDTNIRAGSKFHCFTSKRERTDNQKWQLCSRPIETKRGSDRGISVSRLFKTAQRCCNHGDGVGFALTLKQKREGLYVCDLCPDNTSSNSTRKTSIQVFGAEDRDNDINKTSALINGPNGYFEVNITSQLSDFNDTSNSTMNTTQNDNPLLQITTELVSSISSSPNGAVHGGWGEWNPNGLCSVTCGEGQQNFVRICNNPLPSNGGRNCKGRSSKTRKCGQILPCPVHGGWSDWKSSACSETCGVGRMTKMRSCTNPSPANGGQDCEGEHTVHVKCKTEIRCPVDGGWTFWSRRSACLLGEKEVCGAGYTVRTRSCEAPKPLFGGRDCQGSAHLIEDCMVSCCDIFEPGEAGCLLDGSGDSDDED